LTESFAIGSLTGSSPRALPQAAARATDVTACVGARPPQATWQSFQINAGATLVDGARRRRVPSVEASRCRLSRSFLIVAAHVAAQVSRSPEVYKAPKNTLKLSGGRRPSIRRSSDMEARAGKIQSQAFLRAGLEDGWISDRHVVRDADSRRSRAGQRPRSRRPRLLQNQVPEPVRCRSFQTAGHRPSSGTRTFIRFKASKCFVTPDSEGEPPPTTTTTLPGCRTCWISGQRQLQRHRVVASDLGLPRRQRTGLAYAESLLGRVPDDDVAPRPPRSTTTTDSCASSITAMIRSQDKLPGLMWSRENPEQRRPALPPGPACCNLRFVRGSFNERVLPAQLRQRRRPVCGADRRHTVWLQSHAVFRVV
jgi:hypothetical protein